jgi:hypothetical protein
MSEFISSNTKAKQRALLLAAMRQAPVSTIEARETLGISHPAGRIMEARKLGAQIITVSRTVHDAQGRPHRCAVYAFAGMEGGSQ